VQSLRVRMLSQTFSLAHMSAYDVVPQMRFSKGAITTLHPPCPGEKLPHLVNSGDATYLQRAVGTLHPRRRPWPWVHGTRHVACFRISCVVWKDRQPPWRSSPALRLFLSRLSLRIHARHGYGARGERGTRTERRASEERARSASGRHQLGGNGAGREAQRKRARVGGTSYPRGHGALREAQRKRARPQEGARQEGASTRGREHRRRKLRGVRVSELPKQPANNCKVCGSNRRSPGIPFRLPVHLQVTVILFMINMLINPQTTCKLPANVNSGLPNAVNAIATSSHKTTLED
jgi:hypothetical protein